MTPAHLLYLSDLHHAAPGSLDVIFGPDGDFDGAPRWTGPVYGRIRGRLAFEYHHACTRYDAYSIGVMRSDGARKGCEAPALDLLVPSVAARLGGLCVRASKATRPGPFSLDALAAVGSGQIPPRLAEHLASMTLALAPQIAALGVDR